MTHEDIQTIELGLRGQLRLRLKAEGPAFGIPVHALHSGHSSLFNNPIDVMAQCICAIKEGSEIKIPLFFEDVEPPNIEELSLLDQSGDFFNTLVSSYDKRLSSSEKDHRGFLYGMFFEPNINLSAIRSGATGEEIRLVPNTASLNLDISLVPGQKADQILNCTQDYLRERGFGQMSIEVLAMREPYRTDPSHAFAQEVISLSSESYAKPPIILPSSASSGPPAIIPNNLNIPMIRIGTAYRGLAHCPDEYIMIEQYQDYVDFAELLLSRLKD
ncbi:peptidase dimerization domain-containing protein [Gemmatimonadota bacterium]